MMRSLIKLAVFLLILSSTAFSQEISSLDTLYERMSFDFIGAGARAEGMGNAYIGVSSDIFGAAWNPAGIYNIDKPVCAVSWGSLVPRGSSVTTSYSSFLKTEHTGSLKNINSVNFASPIRIKGHPFVGSFSYTRNFDLFESWTMNTMYESPFVFYVSGTGYEYDTLTINNTQAGTLDGGMNSINFAFGTRLYDKYTFGVALNVYSGKAVRDYYVTNKIDDFRYWDGVQVGTYVQNITVEDTNKFSGFNLTVGFKMTGEKLDAGLIIRTPFSLRDKYERAIYAITSFNDLIYDDGTDTTYYGNNLIKYDMPFVIGAGIGYHLKENLLLAADFEFRKFSGKKVKIRESITINPGGDNVEVFREIDPNWSNVFTFRTGMEYLWDKSFGTIPLRAGFAYVPEPRNSVNLNNEDESVTDWKLSAGTGIHWEQIKLDFAYTYTASVWKNYNIESNNRDHHFNVSFTGVF